MMKKKAKPALKKAVKKDIEHELDIPKNLKRDRPVTGTIKQLQIRAVNNAKKVIGHIERSFDTAAEAAEYLAELVNVPLPIPPDAISASSNGLVATIGKVGLELNYDIRKICRKLPIEPEELMPSLHDFGAKSKTEIKTLSPAAPAKERPGVVTQKPLQKSNGTSVVLKVLCSELDMEPRKARAKLRKLQEDKKLPPEVEGGRWEWSRENAEKVKALLR